jgi:hypothetical protein
VKSIKKVLSKIGEIFDRVLEALIGQRQPEHQLVPIPVRNNSRRARLSR